jgi:RNA polymerase sigma factor (sigma-70 family)
MKRINGRWSPMPCSPCHISAQLAELCHLIGRAAMMRQKRSCRGRVGIASATPKMMHLLQGARDRDFPVAESEIFAPVILRHAPPCNLAWWCSDAGMSADFREQGRWLARNVLPHEALIRARLRDMCLYDLDIEDVIQEMYARFLTLESLESIRFPRQYALLTARAIIIDHIRHSRVVSITSSGNLEALEIATPEASGEERVEFQEEVRAVTAALDQLPKACRETLILRRVEGLSQKEVALRLNISEKTVEKHMANGVRMLIKMFGRGGKPRAHTSSSQEMILSNDARDKPGN